VPQELVDQLKASESLGRPLGWIRQVALATVSLDLYSGDPQTGDVSEATRASYARYAPEPLPAEYHFAAAFGHLTGYSACYYTYAWSAVIARDLLSPFLRRGDLADPQLADRYAREILMPGSERPAAELIRAYLGRSFGFTAFERWATAPALPPDRRPRRAARAPSPATRVRPANGRSAGGERAARSRKPRPRR